MHTPEGTLERSRSHLYTTTNILEQGHYDQVQVPHMLSLPNMDDKGNFTHRLLFTICLIQRRANETQSPLL